jgi:hypothetical protein
MTTGPDTPPALPAADERFLSELAQQLRADSIRCSTAAGSGQKTSRRRRTWCRHDPAKFEEFRRQYTSELAGPGAREALARLRALAADRPVTLLTATKDLDLSQAAVLAGLLRDTA